MNDLIEALQIFAKYADNKWPTHCEHEILMIVGIHANDVSDEDQARLEELGFDWDTWDEVFRSYRFGSA